MRDTFKNKVLDFVNANGRDQKRQFYIKTFMDFGMTENSASIYHFLHVTKAKKISKIQVTKGPARDPKTGRFLKKAA